MSNLYFQIFGIFVLILISIVYFSKKRVDSLETKIYSTLLIISFFALFFDITIVTITYLMGTAKTLLLLEILNKFYITSILLWVYLFTVYIFNVSFDLKTKKLRMYIWLKNMSIITYLIFVLIIFILKVNIFNENNVMYSFGPSLDFMTAIACLYIFLIITFVLIKIKDINNKKYKPVYVLISIMILNVIIRQIDPGILITTAIISYVDLVMFFTIENPDLKMINELNIARNQAETANHAKTNFLSSMSHEIRTPLNAIVGFSECIANADDLNSAKEDAKDVIMASQNLLEIVNGILDISKIEADKMEIVESDYEIEKVLLDVAKLVAPRISEKPIEFKTNFAEDLPYLLHGDRGKVTQVITNLLTNAAKYTEKGMISFTASCVNVNNECRLVISVEDTGRGIKPEKIDKLFQKFERLDEDKNTTLEGTGLGLAITKKLTEMMGGKIVVQSKYEQGSNFTVYLKQNIVKLTRDITNEVLSTGERVEELDYSNKKILIVDDNNLNLKVASRLLQAFKVQTETVLSGFECLDKINNGEKFDLILMDDMMPKMSGGETLHKLKEIQNFNIPVVALTANAISGMKEKYLADGFDDYLAKPIERPELNKIIKKFLDTKNL
ncbi:MAG: ATP-binding protein [Ignavibacteriales bacterium]